ncbi:MAG: lipoxygenase family protein [Synechococcaceae cyanobacterium]
MLSFLRHLDPAGEIRERELKKCKSKWSYNYTYLEGVAFANSVPAEDGPPLEWITLLANVIAKAGVNEAAVARQLLHIDDNRLPLLEELEYAKKKLNAIKKNGVDLNIIARYLASEYKEIGMGSVGSIRQYQELFKVLPVPASYFNDQLFAQTTLAGPLPNKLKRIHGLPDDFPVTNTHYQSVMGTGDTLEEALQEGRTFLWDFSLFDGVTCGTFPLNQQKYIGSPLALFAIAKVKLGVRQLTPIAIQCFTSKDTANPIFTPSNGTAWEMAKMTVRSAAANYHEVIAHFTHTHLVIEAFAVSARRQLHTRHPIMRLVHSHFEGTLYINKLAHEQLLRPGGGVDTVMAGEIGASRDMICKAIKAYNFDAEMFPNVMAAMGVDDLEILPEYPYRDDGILLWNAISTWVDSYVAIYYENDDAVLLDHELQAWWSEVSDMESGGRISGMGAMVSVDYLAKALTHLIFTASCQHAAVNFAQGDFMSLVTNMPTALYAQMPTCLEGYKEADLLALLPPLHAAQSQVNLATLLGTLYFTKLGDYGVHLTDPKVRGPLQQFQDDLKKIEQKISRRNKVRLPYCHLMPSKIPQSINI